MGRYLVAHISGKEIVCPLSGPESPILPRQERKKTKSFPKPSLVLRRFIHQAAKPGQYLPVLVARHQIISFGLTGLVVV